MRTGRVKSLSSVGSVASMLKALELAGFKSFADKTRFDFPAGITVVVGPNGSGKSNIVDAIKWVLGEQSAKDLRGKDMSDVIFKGSGGAGGRKPLNSAEATLILDNADKRFSYDAAEISVTRRVYRNGESEYLINGAPCRLKDVRDLFRGTGAGTDAYSLIEQGKVERMLQASTKDRRAIFEEAAGISRYKAKKIETQRRLARVDQNLLRLNDIVEEVESRLRAVKAQASKALRYREYSERLKFLRTAIGHSDWERFTSTLQDLYQKKETGVAALQEIGETRKSLEAEIAVLNQDSESFQLESTELEASLLQHKQTLLTVETAAESARQRLIEVESNLSRLRHQLLIGRRRLNSLHEESVATSKLVEDAELEFRKAADLVQSLEARIDTLRHDIAATREELTTLNSRQVELIKEESDCSSNLRSTKKDLDANLQRRDKALAKQRILTHDLTEAIRIFEEKRIETDRLYQDLELRNSAIADLRVRLDHERKEFQELSDKYSQVQIDYSAICQRAAVLEELESKLEGLNSGVKELLRNAKTQKSGPYQDIAGMVADLIQVHVQHATLVDVALDEYAQYLVLQGDELLNEVIEGKISLSSRVGLLRAGQIIARGSIRTDLTGLPGVIGRMDELVQTNPGFHEVATLLLGGTWIVKTLADGVRLRNEFADDVRYVSLDGQLVERGGIILAGPRSMGLGIVSRRSELRELKRTQAQFEKQLEQIAAQRTNVKEQVEQFELQLTQLSNEQGELSRAHSESKLLASGLAQKREQLERENLDNEAVLSESSARVVGLQSSVQQLESRHELLFAELEDLKKNLSSLNSKEKSLNHQLEKSNSELTEEKIQLAKREQQLEHAESRMREFENERTARQSTVDSILEQLFSQGIAQRSLISSQLKATAAAAETYLEKDRVSLELARFQRKKRELHERRQQVLHGLDQSREHERHQQGDLHKVELQIGQLEMERDTLASRLRDDYGLDIASFQAAVQESAEPLPTRQEIDAEIEGLRRKINSIGAVNMDALQELEEVEMRFNALSSQYQDLVQGKESLEKIIEKINSDSRKLFADTLEIIRKNFQSLYRRSFGGGKADLVIEEGVDILEAGIDIVATPPGKPEFSNSLLSGGEKALTAVSLLLAIFQFRPSPFCVLDEVDAPFDEANVGRFIDVLKDFLSSTKFIIVTHSKKTMTSANTLYGITMQESGVSKRVSVRFEDVSDDGRISDEAVKREDSNDANERDVA